MNVMSRRRFGSTAATGLGVLALAACGGPSGGQTGGQAGSKLTGTFELWQPWPIEQPTHGGPIGWKQLMDNFNAKEGPKVSIITPSGNLDVAVQTGFAAGTPPDAWQTTEQTTVLYAAKGFSAPLDDLMKRDKWDKNQIFPTAYETMSWMGRPWAIMQHPDIVFMWYSVTLMEQNGISSRTMPTNWMQLDELMLRLTKRAGDGFDFVGGIPHIWQNWNIAVPQANGAKLVSDDGKKAQLDTPEVIDAIEWAKGHLKRLGTFDSIESWRRTLTGGDNHTPGNPVGLPDMFGSRKIAAIAGGNWTADNIRRWNKKLNEPLKFAVSPIPSGSRGPRDPKPNVFSGGILSAARKAGPKLDLAWEFFKFIASKEGGYWVQLNTSDVAANREAARDPRIVDHPDTGVGRKEFLSLFETGIGARTIRHPVYSEINNEYNRPINAYLRDQAGNLRDGLREANRLAQQRIDEFWQQNPSAGQ